MILWKGNKYEHMTKGSDINGCESYLFDDPDDYMLDKHTSLWDNLAKCRAQEKPAKQIN